MFKKFISQQRSGWIIIIAIYATVGSCEGCDQKKNTKIALLKSSTATPTPTLTPTDDINPDNLNGSTDSLDSAASDSLEVSSLSGVSIGSSSSGPSSYSSSSGYDSGSASSAPFRPVPSGPTDFAGLTPIGNTCYMNSVLQIIAALYKDKVQGNDALKDLVHKINIGFKPLGRKDMEQFVDRLPQKAKDMAKSGQQQDPAEFITHLMEGIAFLNRIEHTERFIIKEIDKDEKPIFRKKDNKKSKNECEFYIALPFFKSGSSFNLNEMIKSYTEEFVKEGDLKIASQDYSPHGQNAPCILNGDENDFKPVENNVAKSYIKQIIFNEIPSILYIQLKRFKYGTLSSKITDPVSEAVNITIYPDPSSKGNPINFDLHGFIVHSGPNPNSGHYIAYVKRGAQWYEADDTSITKVDASQAEGKSKQAYLLFYKKQ